MRRSRRARHFAPAFRRNSPAAAVCLCEMRRHVSAMAQKGRGTGRLARDVSECRRAGRRCGGGAEEVGRGVRVIAVGSGHIVRG
ncbi:MAG: hypothetical protein ACTHLN_03375, partial [Tepidisphaeraceae bacterium]